MDAARALDVHGCCNGLGNGAWGRSRFVSFVKVLTIGLWFVTGKIGHAAACCCSKEDGGSPLESLEVFSLDIT
jgi:hypothetical protein